MDIKDFPMPTRSERASELLAASRSPHAGVFITAPETLELLEDSLPEAAYTDGSTITASLGNCRCTSDAKAIKQFTAHARVPSDAAQIALGHECLHMILQAPAASGLKPGDLTVITPGHAAQPVDPNTMNPAADGVLAAMGYSYRYLGGLRTFNAIPASAADCVRENGFGNLYSSVPDHPHASLTTLAHAEPFACNYGTNAHIFFEAGDGSFRYGVPPRANVAYLGGTARMAMVNLTIVANVPDDELPQVVSITGSASKLRDLAEFALIRRLRAKGVVVQLIDRQSDSIVEQLTQHGRPDVIWTNFAAAEVYDQAVTAIAPGGNINSYAGAADPALALPMTLTAAPAFADLAAEAQSQVQAMHHNLTPNDRTRQRGLATTPRVRLIGFDAGRAEAYAAAMPAGAITDEGPWTDVFIAGTGDGAAAAYADVELQLARNAAVNLVDGDCTIQIRSRHTHYTTRHQICGSNVPWTMTNTSEPAAADLARQAIAPIDFDWMVTGVVGLNGAVDMMEKVGASSPFGSFFVFNDLPNLPFVDATSESFRAAAAAASGLDRAALSAAADALDSHGNSWCRAAEEALYEAYGVPYPLAL